MRSIIVFFFLGQITNALAFRGINSYSLPVATTAGFTENKGQVSDQYYQPRPDVLFTGSSEGINYYLRNNGISYQLARIDTWAEAENHRGPVKTRLPNQSTSYRIDISWINCNTNALIQRGTVLPGYSNYYLAACPQGIDRVQTFSDVIYKGLYNMIDLHYYMKGQSLKYDYVVAPYGDYKQIKLQVEGAVPDLQEDGTLIMRTPLGDIQEGAPLVYQDGRQIAARWLVEGNTLSFEIAGFDPSHELVIDPLVRLWGTYFGGGANGMSGEIGYACETDNAGNVYLTGASYIPTTLVMATTGAHQVTLSGGANDAFLARFNSSGMRQWCTYYGGNGDEHAHGLAVTGAGDVYMCGTTSSSVAISTSGSHQSSLAGIWNAFLVKFNNAGTRQWGTYCGGTYLDDGMCVALDGSNNIYMSGYTSTGSTLIASAGSHQSTFAGGNDAFLIKFNPAGVRQWGTYYGGASYELGASCCYDPAGFIYLSGYADAPGSSGISTPGSHQPLHGGAVDGFLAKFDLNGVRQWGTFYGGSGDDGLWACTVDANGNVYATGETNTPGGTSIATAGSHQQTFAGGQFNRDALLVKFNSAGVRQWGTYYGGNEADNGMDCVHDNSGNVYITGWTKSANGIAFSPAYQSTYGGAFDVFFAKFNSGGTIVWGTYYGGNDDEQVRGLYIDQNNQAYLSGTTSSSTSIASPGSFQSTYGGGQWNAFLIKFGICAGPAPSVATPSGNLSICSNQTTTLFAGGTGTLSWYASATGTAALGTGTVYQTTSLSGPNVFTFYVASSDCNFSRTPVSVTVNLASIQAGSSNSVCAGNVAVLSASGAATYTWNTGSNSSSIAVNPAVTMTYMVAGTDSNGCIDSVQVVQVVNPCLGIEEPWHALQGSIYPNPFIDVIEINYSGPGFVEIYNAQGMLLSKNEMPGERFSLRTTDLPAGLYTIMIRAREHKGIAATRLIKISR